MARLNLYSGLSDQLFCERRAVTAVLGLSLGLW